MEIIVTINEKGIDYRKGIMTIDGRTVMSTLEPVDKGLEITDSMDIINLVKSKGKCAIPYGRYKILMEYSNANKTIVPKLQDVPGFSEIEIHIGNSSEDTKGCILVGIVNSSRGDWVCYSRSMFLVLCSYIKQAKDEDIFITLKPN